MAAGQVIRTDVTGVVLTTALTSYFTVPSPKTTGNVYQMLYALVHLLNFTGNTRLVTGYALPPGQTTASNPMRVVSLGSSNSLRPGERQEHRLNRFFRTGYRLAFSADANTAVVFAMSVVMEEKRGDTPHLFV